MMNLRLAFDIDGVIMNIAEEMCIRLRADGIENAYVENFVQFSIEETFGVDNDWFPRNAADPTFWLNAEPYKDAWFMINKWFSEGHDIFFVTARGTGRASEISKEMTVRSLDEWEIPYNEIFYVKHLDKHAMIKELDVEFFVEDRKDEAEEIARMGIVSYLIDRPWNQGPTPAIRIKELSDLDGTVIK